MRESALKRADTKKSGRLAWIVGAAALILVIGIVSVIVASRNRESSATPAKASVTTVKWSAVTLADGEQFIGKRLDVGTNGFIAYDDVYYMTAAPDSSTPGKLRRFGQEVHRPLPLMLIPNSAVLFEETLTAKSSAVLAIAKSEKTDSGPKTPKPVVPSGEVHGVALRDGQVYFGPATLSGDALVIQPAYFLRYRNAGVATSGQIRSLDELVLVPQSAAPLGSTGALRVPLSAVLYIQPLSSDSPVIGALKK